MEELQRRYLQLVLEENGWNRRRAATVLNLDRRTIQRLIARYQLQGAPDPEDEAETEADVRRGLWPASTDGLAGCRCARGCSVRLAAQTGPVVARAASVTGAASGVRQSAGSFSLSAGFQLNPGDRVDTRGGGRVVIDLSDGSMVVVEPQSIVVLKDFRQAESLRELFEITLGKVRVKINHFGGRPNPYRMNSPTASIAVRGTEFSIEVSASGDTQVIVYRRRRAGDQPVRSQPVGPDRGRTRSPGSGRAGLPHAGRRR